MRNKRIIWIDLIIFIVFNVIAFVIPTNFTKTFWISYVFTVIMFGIQSYMWIAFFQKNPDATSRFYRIPILSVCNRYIVIQGLSFFIFKFLPTLPIWVVVIINVLILAWVLIGFVTLSGAADYVATIDEKVKPKVAFIKTLQADVEILSSREDDAEIKRELEQLADKIKYSDPMSDSSLFELELKIQQNIKLIGGCDNAQEVKIIKETILLIDERNKKCKLLK